MIRCSAISVPGGADISTTRSARNTASRTLCVTKTNVFRVSLHTSWSSRLEDLARLRVERRERLVGEQHLRLARERARQRRA